METCLLTESEVRERARQIWLLRGGDPGKELEDWLRAELELKIKPGAIPDDESPREKPAEADNSEYPNGLASFAWFWGGPTHLKPFP